MSRTGPNFALTMGSKVKCAESGHRSGLKRLNAWLRFWKIWVQVLPRGGFFVFLSSKNFSKAISFPICNLCLRFETSRVSVQIFKGFRASFYSVKSYSDLFVNALVNFQLLGIAGPWQNFFAGEASAITNTLKRYRCNLLLEGWAV